MKKIISYALLGAIVGFICSYAIANGSLLKGWSMDDLSFPITLSLLCVNAIFLLIILISYMQIKRKENLSFSGEAEDEHEKWMYNKFSLVSLASSSGIIIALTAASIAVITNQTIELLIVALIFLIISIPVTIVPNHIMRIVYKDRELPNPNDKEYGKKLLMMADEGERHVMLEGLYKSFQMTNFLLPLAILVLMFYSEISGDSQLFGIFIIGVITVLINARYILKIRQV